MIVKAKLMFDDNSTMTTMIEENILIEQMKRLKMNRLYKCGIEFSAVEKIEVL